jgi:tRNA(Ile)-lysidine synthase
MKLITQVENIFESHQISISEIRLLLAVSGGKDSMVLMSVLIEMGVYFEVAHMNYQLRDEDSNLDEEIVEQVCVEKGIKFHVKKVETKSYCEETKMSTQEAARILRYEWFESLLKLSSLDFITTAHHSSDNHETFLQNLKRGSGLRGLKGMVFLQNKRCKPMIKLTRTQIDDFAMSQNIKYRDDASNNQNHYQRNLIRNKILPEIENEMPGLKLGLTKSILNLQSDYDFLLQSLEKESDAILVRNDSGFIVNNYKMHHPRLMLHILEKFGFNEAQCLDILNANQAGRQVFNENYVVTINSGNLLIHPPVLMDYSTVSIPAIGTYDLNDSKFFLAETQLPSTFSSEKSHAMVDADQLTFPMTVRPWTTGDKFQPLGMKGTKKISDFLTDQKIPLNEKSSVKVLISNEKIVWVIGLCVNEKFKITKSTRKVIKLETILN